MFIANFENIDKAYLKTYNLVKRKIYPYINNAKKIAVNQAFWNSMNNFLENKLNFDFFQSKFFKYYNSQNIDFKSDNSKKDIFKENNFEKDNFITNYSNS